ncbi:MAG: hypothetical protein CK526_01270 [Thaumarchaeota archaeon]|nr:hypothetical protein [Nitrosopumilus sp.]PHY04905.1 MAG: hypothetical protein CK526_01270 [Nitrososphaerota archaeon]
MADDSQNKQAMKEAIDTLNLIASTNSTPKPVRKTVNDLVTDLIKEEYSLSIRAANTISLLDDITQDPNMPSYVRTQLWQAVSKLESIRE